MHIDTEQFNTGEPPEHICPEAISAEASKDYKIRIYLIPIPTRDTWEDQPHIVISHKENGNLCGTNVDFCPYCGQSLATLLREKTTEKTLNSTPITKEYFEYRQRFIKEGIVGSNHAPIRESKWQVETKRFENTVRILNAAQEHFKPQLIEDLKELKNILCLSEDYLRNYQIPDEVSPNQNDSE